ncbi:hypothetical protein [Solibacillus sp. FSL H8-0538]|uniref:hypothetical protein n=1 Tax=Solibacillus sp. FSL H8-0538 TaxID=2921400 RepID=UPI0030F67236
MIDINTHIISALSPLNKAVAFQALPKGSTLPDQYVTFLEINANPSLEAADKEFETERLIQLNIWSKSNPHTLSENIKKLMDQAGYERTFEHDAPYNEGDSHFNKVMRFAFFDDY